MTLDAARELELEDGLLDHGRADLALAGQIVNRHRLDPEAPEELLGGVTAPSLRPGGPVPRR